MFILNHTNYAKSLISELVFSTYFSKKINKKIFLQLYQMTKFKVKYHYISRDFVLYLFLNFLLLSIWKHKNILGTEKAFALK